jgi:hypothetical protein
MRVSSDSLAAFGTGLARPECVVCLQSGVVVSDWRGGVTFIGPDGSQRSWLAESLPFALRPNGIAPSGRNTVLVAHLGDTGGVWELSAAGRATPVLTEVDGIPLPPTNFVIRDRATGDRRRVHCPP